MKVINCIFFVVYLLISCASFRTDNRKEVTSDTVHVFRTDTVIITNNNGVDSLTRLLTETRDSLKFYRDSMTYNGYINSRRIEKIKYYISICDRKPSNKKFFFGWIKRTMSED